MAANLEARIIAALDEFSWGISAEDLLHEMIDHAIVEGGGAEDQLPDSGRGLITTLNRMAAQGKIIRKVHRGLSLWALERSREE